MQDFLMTDHAIVRAIERGGRKDLRAKVASARERGIQEAEIAAMIGCEHPDVVEAARAELEAKRTLLLSRPGGAAILGDMPAHVRIPLSSGMRAVVKDATIVTFLPKPREWQNYSERDGSEACDRERHSIRKERRFVGQVGRR